MPINYRPRRAGATSVRLAMASSQASRSPSVAAIVQPSIPSPHDWTISRVRCTLDEHEDGIFLESSQLARAFGRDDRIGPCITDRINALVGADAARFSLLPVDGDLKAKSEALVPLVQAWWPKVVTSAWERSALYDGITLGVSLSRVVWQRTDRQWTPVKLVKWHADNFDWSETDRLFVARTDSSSFVPILPDDPNWFLFQPGGDRTWMSGAIRALGLAYVFRGWDYRDWARFNERHGQPIIKIIEPSGEQKPGSKNGFYGGIKRMGSSGIIRLPQGQDERTSYDVDLMEAKARSWDSFRLFQDQLNVAIAIQLKGQNLTTEVQSGAYSSTGWHMRVRKDYAAGDALPFGDDLRRQIIQHWGRFQISGWDDDAAPWPTWDLEIPEDLKQVAETFASGANAIATLRGANVPFDEVATMQRLGIPVLATAQPGQQSQ